MTRLSAWGCIAVSAVLVASCAPAKERNGVEGFLTGPSQSAQVRVTPDHVEMPVGQSETLHASVTPALQGDRFFWSIKNGIGTESVLLSNSNNSGEAKVECAKQGFATVDVKSQAASSNTASATITCIGSTGAIPPSITLPPTPPSNTTPPSTPPPTPPSTGPTIGSIIGTYTKQGQRISGDCRPPLFNAQWDADLTVESSSEGNQGIRMREEHPGQNSAGPYAIVLFYSQFDAKTAANGDLTLTSGTPTRQVIDRDVVTQIELTFKGDGSITGTETFMGPGPCREVYLLSGKRR